MLTLDTTWPGRAAIAIGDLETAEYVSYFVPGMWFSTDRLIVEWTVIAEDLYTEQTRWAREIGRDDPALRGASVATIAWIGYETPGVVDVGSLDLARTGATALAGAVGGEPVEVADERGDAVLQRPAGRLRGERPPRCDGLRSRRFGEQPRDLLGVRRPEGLEVGAGQRRKLVEHRAAAEARDRAGISRA